MSGNARRVFRVRAWENRPEDKAPGHEDIFIEPIAAYDAGTDVETTRAALTSAAFPEYQSRLERFVRRISGNGEYIDPEDLVSMAFIRAHNAMHRFDMSKKFSTWIYTIAGNLAKNELRNRSRSPLRTVSLLTQNRDEDYRPLEFEDSTYRPDEMLRKRWLQDRVEEAIEQLPEHHRVVFRLREQEGKTYEDIADLTGVQLGTVKSRINRARSNFAELMRPYV